MLSPKQTLDEYYLEVRCKLLEVAAILDRHGRACARDPEAANPDDPRLDRFRRSLAILSDERATPDRAERVALVFSDE